MKFFKVLFVLVALSFHQASNAQVSIDVCAYRKAAYVDTLDNLSIGASITTWAAGMPVIALTLTKPDPVMLKIIDPLDAH
jgi:hypothetical protein